MNLNVIAPTSSVYFLNNTVPLSSQAMYNRPFYNTAPINQYWMSQPSYAMAPNYLTMDPFSVPSYYPQQQAYYQPVYNQMPLTWGYW